MTVDTLRPPGADPLEMFQSQFRQDQGANDPAVIPLHTPLFRNRQTTLRMDRHETIVAERCETFRYYCIVGVLG